MDKAAAQKIIDETQAKVKALEAEAEALTGKDNKKARNAKSREAADLKKEPDFMDAERIIAGKEPLQDKNKAGGGAAAKEEEPKFEAVKGAGPAGGGSPKKEEKKEEKEKKEKKPKKDEGAGISPDERKELEDLKKQIVEKKTALKAEGLSGGQQNKDPDVVRMVTRMNELKEKAGELGSPKKDKEKGKAKKGNPEEIEKLKREIEEYKTKLKTEFGYTNKDIVKDEDIMEMTKRLKAMGV
jgi:hypothetical protein